MERDTKSKRSKMVKILVIANAVLMLGMALFCYQNASLNIDGICDECCIYTKAIFTFSMMLLVVQAVAVVIMLRQSMKNDESNKYGLLSIFACIGAFLAVIQIGASYINPGISTHGQNVKAEEMMEIQLVVAMIINAVLIITNVIIFVSARRAIHQANMEYAEELANNHIMDKLEKAE